ncbi:diacylglycerol kinase [Helicobacter sp. UBA3407]|uniref:diacylglycerol kinase n=1 Tax=Helicobacter TaxID=209 RepID=UPI00263249F2|nr:diacylglycerol kinase [Helicobacter sp. UBA3407]
MKPKYHFFKNTKYALCGVLAMLKNEAAFKLECLIIIPLLFVAFYLEIPLEKRILLIAVLWLILIAECFNSAIESCVDLITQEFHVKAKIAKDCASAGVFFAISLAILTWGLVLGDLYLW